MNWKRGKGGALILAGRRIGFTASRPLPPKPEAKQQ